MTRPTIRCAIYTRKSSEERGGSVCLNRFRALSKWFSAWIMPPPLLAPAG